MPINNQGKYINPGWMNDGPPAIDAAELNAISDTLENLDAGGGTSGGKRYARVVVGTSTNGWTAEGCDYLCDGVDDEVEINAAAQDIPNSGGEILLLDGTYNISNYISLKIYTTQSGTGRASTRLVRTGVSDYGTVRAMLVLPNECELKNLSISGGLSVFGSGDWSSVTDVLAGGGTKISNVSIGNSINDSFYLEPIMGPAMVVSNCDFGTCETAIHIDCNGEVIVSDSSFFSVPGSYIVRAIGILQDDDQEKPLKSPLTVKMTNCIDRSVYGEVLLDGTGYSSITNCNFHAITIQMTQEEDAYMKPERGRHVLLGNTFHPTNNSDALITFGTGVNNCIAIGNILSGGNMVGTVVDNGENNIVYNGASGGQVTLSPSGWSSNQQTVTAPGVTTSNYVTTGPTPATFTATMEAGVYCSGQGNGTLTFTCTTTPSSSITYTYTAQEVL